MGIVTAKDPESYGFTIQAPFHDMSEKINKYHIRSEENLNDKSHATILGCFNSSITNNCFV